MADPAASAPLTDAASERRISAADQMAALTGEPVELSQAEADEPAEDLEARQDRQIADLSKTAPFDASTGAAPSPINRSNPHRPPALSDTAAAPVSPPAPSDSAPSSKAERNPAAAQPVPPASRNTAGNSSPNAAHPPNEASRSPQGTAPLSGTAMVAAALTGGFRRHAEPPIPASSAPKDASNDDRAAPSLLDRLAIKSILDSLRRPEAKAPASRSAPTAGAAESLTAADPSASKAPSPRGALRDKLGVFTADRMQARRDAEEIKGVSQAGSAVLASLEALERQETTGILNKIRDAANANGGIERVLTEMRPGGAFEDLRKEFNVALSHDEGFTAAYEKATGALSSYAETRAGMSSAPHPRADINLARLETLDQEIGTAAKALPGLKDGKNALDEALEGGKEAVEKAFTAIRQAFTRDADVRGPSPSPRFGP